VLPDKYLYLALMLGSLAYPIAQSFERRITMYRKWKHLFPAIFITAGFFLIWDEFFTRIGVWSFNHNYVMGIYIGSLPLEEWLFFLVVPYACFFVYFVADYFIKKDLFRTTYRQVSVIITVILLVFAGIYHNRWYTATTCILPALLLIWLTFVKQVDYLGRFFTGYFISLIPFLIVNGVLTSKPVVIYNDAENSGFRIFISGISNIPVEDLAYCLLLLLMNISLYERFRSKV
jgi:lycopene cyclase domain-containing protein